MFYRVADAFGGGGRNYSVSFIQKYCGQSKECYLYPCVYGKSNAEQSLGNIAHSKLGDFFSFLW
jgi:hypothetical protein